MAERQDSAGHGWLTDGAGDGDPVPAAAIWRADIARAAAAAGGRAAAGLALAADPIKSCAGTSAAASAILHCAACDMVHLAHSGADTFDASPHVRACFQRSSMLWASALHVSQCCAEVAPIWDLFRNIDADKQQRVLRKWEEHLAAQRHYRHPQQPASPALRALQVCSCWGTILSPALVVASRS